MPKGASSSKTAKKGPNTSLTTTSRLTRRNNLSLTSTPVANSVDKDDENDDEKPRVQRDSAKKAINYFLSSVNKKPVSLFKREKEKISLMNADERAKYFESTHKRYEAAKLMCQEMKLVKESTSKKRSRSTLSPKRTTTTQENGAEDEDDLSAGKKARSESSRIKTTKEKKEQKKRHDEQEEENDDEDGKDEEEEEDILSLAISKPKEDLNDDSRFSFSQQDNTISSSPIDLSLEITEDQYNITKSASLIVDSNYASESLLWTVVKALIEIKEFVHIKIVDVAARVKSEHLEKVLRENVGKLDRDQVLVYYFHGLDKIDKTFLSSPVIYSLISDQRTNSKTYADLEQILFALGGEQYARSFVFLVPLSYQSIRVYHYLSTVRSDFQVVEAVPMNEGERVFVAYEKSNEAFYNQVKPVLERLVADQYQDLITKEPGFPSILVRLYESMSAKRSSILKTLLGNCVKIDQPEAKKSEKIDELKERLTQEFEQCIKPLLPVESKKKRHDITI